MKLYTESQVKKAIELAQECDHECGGVYFYSTETEIIEELTPIELPTDDEIEEGLFHQSNEYAYGYKDAFEWIIEQIKKKDL